MPKSPIAHKKTVKSNLDREPKLTLDELPLFEVQTLITHRVRYAVRARSAKEAGEAVAGLDSEIFEFDQNCLGKVVADVREVSVAQYLADPGHLGDSGRRLAMIHRVEAEPPAPVAKPRRAKL